LKMLDFYILLNCSNSINQSIYLSIYSTLKCLYGSLLTGTCKGARGRSEDAYEPLPPQYCCKHIVILTLLAFLLAVVFGQCGVVWSEVYWDGAGGKHTKYSAAICSWRLHPVTSWEAFIIPQGCKHYIFCLYCYFDELTSEEYFLIQFISLSGHQKIY